MATNISNSKTIQKKKENIMELMNYVALNSNYCLLSNNLDTEETKNFKIVINIKLKRLIWPT